MPLFGNWGIDKIIICTEEILRETQCEGTDCALGLTTGYICNAHEHMTNIWAKELPSAEPQS
jgi:hypothetical protein